MSFPRDAYPYTNFHELNLGYFIVHFREIFSQWADLYDQMLNWKNATDEELATWKAGVEADLDQREAALRAELETWKAQTGQDIAGWEDATLAALTAWQTATQAVFEAIRVEAAGSASAAAASAGDAATAKTAAETAQAAAEAAAASVQASAAQITTNTEDIADLKAQLNQTNLYNKIDENYTSHSGGAFRYYIPLLLIPKNTKVSVEVGVFADAEPFYYGLCDATDHTVKYLDSKNMTTGVNSFEITNIFDDCYLMLDAEENKLLYATGDTLQFRGYNPGRRPDVGDIIPWNGSPSTANFKISITLISYGKEIFDKVDTEIKNNTDDISAIQSDLISLTGANWNSPSFVYNEDATRLSDICIQIPMPENGVIKKLAFQENSNNSSVPVYVYEWDGVTISVDAFRRKATHSVTVINGLADCNIPVNKGDYIGIGAITDLNAQVVYWNSAKQGVGFVYRPENNAQIRNYPNIYVTVSFELEINGSIKDEINAKFNDTDMFINTNRLYGYPFDMAFIGDSLTYGQTYVHAYSGDDYAYKNKANYPECFTRLLNMDNTGKTVIAIPGATTGSLWNARQTDIEAIENQFVICWLGTNGGLTDTVDIDCAGDDISNYADTNTGNYGKIIKTLVNNGNKVFLAQICYTAQAETTNPVIKKLAAKFNCNVIELSNDDIDDLNQSKYHTAYNGYFNAVHFNSIGYNHVAGVFFTKMMRAVYTDPAKFEILKEET